MMKLARMHIAFDLDNTIICYDSAFAEAAIKRGYLPPSESRLRKEAVKATLHAQGKSGVQRWQALQGYIYGPGIDRASLFDGVAATLRALAAEGNLLSIVSHKTIYGHFDETKTNLRDAAVGFLQTHGVTVLIPRSRIFFAETLAEKVAKITKIACDVFVDDLTDVLLHPDFPPATRRLLFGVSQTAPCESAASWHDLHTMLTAHVA